MKQLIQSYKTGELGLFDVPAPVCGDNGVERRQEAGQNRCKRQSGRIGIFHLQFCLGEIRSNIGVIAAQ